MGAEQGKLPRIKARNEKNKTRNTYPHFHQHEGKFGLRSYLRSRRTKIIKEKEFHEIGEFERLTGADCTIALKN